MSKIPNEFTGPCPPVRRLALNNVNGLALNNVNGLARNEGRAFRRLFLSANTAE